MIYDELIEELALTLLTKARYEGCISVIDGFSQCEEDKTRIEYGGAELQSDNGYGCNHKGLSSYAGYRPKNDREDSHRSC